MWYLLNQRDSLQEQLNLKDEMQKIMSNRVENCDVKMKHNQDLVKNIDDVCVINSKLEKNVNYLDGIKAKLTTKNKFLKKSMGSLNAMVKVLMILLFIFLLLM